MGPARRDGSDVLGGKRRNRKRLVLPLEISMAKAAKESLAVRVNVQSTLETSTACVEEHRCASGVATCGKYGGVHGGCTPHQSGVLQKEGSGNKVLG